MKNKLLYALIGILLLSVAGCTKNTNSTENNTASNLTPGPYDHFGDPNWVQTTPGNIVGKFAIIPGVPVEKTVNDINYTYAWADEFDGDALNDEYWSIEINGDGGGNKERQYYLKNNISVGNGFLKIEGREEKYGSKNYTSGRINSKGKVHFKYGYAEAMIAIPSFKGAWPAFWMMGEQYGWPKCGEIDIMEAVNDDANVHSTVHYGENNSGHQQQSIGKYAFSSSTARTGFHHYEMIWDETYITTYVDGERMGTVNITVSNRQKYFHQDFRFILNLAIGGTWPEAEKTFDPTAFTKPQEMYVDFVRVYQVSDI